jgi:predicted DNA-binding protein (UPF0278 family)
MVLARAGMSEHKTGNTTFDKQLYRERREKGLRGQEQAVATTVKTVSRLSRGKHSETRSNLRQQWRSFTRQQRKASARGE